MLSAEQRAEFDEQGFLRLRGMFSRDEASAMEDHVWPALERRHGVRRDEPSSWNVPPRSGLQSTRAHAVFDPTAGPPWSAPSTR